MPTKPEKGEFAREVRGTLAIPGYDDKLIVSDDSVLAQKGGDYAIYKDLLRDDQVQSTFQQRRNAITSKEWVVDPASDRAEDQAAAEFLREQLKRLRWDDITDKAMYGVFYGYHVAELLWEQQGNRWGWSSIKVRDRSRFAFGESGKLYLRSSNSYNYELMPDRKFWTFNCGGDNSDQLYGVGLAHALYWPVFFKRNDIKFWLVFLERYSSPTALAKMPAGQYADEKLRNQVLRGLRDMAADGQIVVPEGTNLQFLESIYSGSASYESMHKCMNDAITKIVLSQTMTTDNGSSRSQSETHKAVRDEVIKADADLICESFNAGPVRWLTEVNFPNAQPPRVWRKTEPPKDLSELAERDTKIISLGYEPTEEYIKQTYGEGWVKKSAQLRVNEDPDDPVFAELSALTATKNAHRADQQTLVEAAQKFATQYRDHVGAQVRQLLEYLDASDDLETFRRRLADLLEVDPPRNQVESLQRAGFVARLLGRMRKG